MLVTTTEVVKVRKPGLIETRASLFLGMRSKIEAALEKLVATGYLSDFVSTPTGFGVMHEPSGARQDLTFPEAIELVRGHGFEVT